MSAIPYIPLYIADYMADTAHLSTEEHGAYLLLIMTYWQRGKSLPASNERLANVVRMSNDRWQSVATTLRAFFIDDGETWTHTRIEADLEKFRIKSEQSKQAGLLSAQRKRNGKATTVITTVPTTVVDPLERLGNHTDTDTDTDKNLNTCDAPQAETPKPEVTKPTAPRGTRFAEETLPDEWADWAVSKLGWSRGFAQDQFEQFSDYWKGVPGHRGVKLDWFATWRNSCKTRPNLAVPFRSARPAPQSNTLSRYID